MNSHEDIASKELLPSGKDVSAFSRIFNFDKYLAKEKIENGILSIVLHSMLIEWTEVNCVGPPSGKELKLLRASEMVFKWTRLDRRPSYGNERYEEWTKRKSQTGSWDTLLPSMLNSSSFEQFASDGGMVERRLYLINNRLRFFRLPINSGRSTSSL